MKITIDKVLDVGRDTLLVYGTRDDLPKVCVGPVSTGVVNAQGEVIVTVTPETFEPAQYQAKVRRSSILGDKAGPFEKKADRLEFLRAMVKDRLMGLNYDTNSPVAGPRPAEPFVKADVTKDIL